MIHIIIMGSGFSKRMGQDKLLIELKGKPVIQWVVEAALKSDGDGITMIYRDTEVLRIAADCRITALYNPLAHLGQSAGIRLAVDSLPEAEAYLFVAGDQPLISPETLNRMIGTYRQVKPDIVTASWKGKRTLPTLFAKSMSEHLRLLEGDQGGRSLIDSGLYKVEYQEINEVQEQWDIDTSDDLEDIRKWLDGRTETGCNEDEEKA